MITFFAPVLAILPKKMTTDKVVIFCLESKSINNE